MKRADTEKRVQKFIHRRWLVIRVPTDLAWEICKLTPCGCEVKALAIDLLRKAAHARAKRRGK